MEHKIFSFLPGNHPWQNHIHLFDTLPSTNDHAKTLAIQGAPEGTVVIARCQTAGRGRLGRRFHAPAGSGLYLSLVLRPGCKPEQLMHLTCATAKASCDAVEQCSGIRPQIKWINDLILNQKKLGGILTELSVSSKTGLIDWAVIGIGINCLHETFPADIKNIATSLLQATGQRICPDRLAAVLIETLYQMNRQLFTEKAGIMEAYRKDCITLGKDVFLLQENLQIPVTVLDLDESGSLIVQFPDGSVSSVCSGEISIRGLCGYL